ncbi:conserved hypothetical protein [Photobacterium leiognathi lrivu.4.1]|uniref:Uncharacterized protein n=1 Tax=Photobacterium leiognathi lrivu.4.1 TaxID=1248232 RepID=V5F2L7_PHOLE|nr:conserved hypothetical protein [Photobacterium leiognathi lrivu.4.1]
MPCWLGRCVSAVTKCMLIESFGFIPLFWLFQLLAFVSLIYTAVKHRK